MYMYAHTHTHTHTDFFTKEGHPVFTTSSLPETGVDQTRLKHIAQVFSSVPEGFNVHPGMTAVGAINLWSGLLKN